VEFAEHRCRIWETNVVLERSQGTLPDPVWEPAGLCGVRTRPLPAGESQESIERCPDGVDLDFPPSQKAPG
jgi:hypothetical protein